MVFIPEETEVTIQENTIPIYSTRVRAGVAVSSQFPFQEKPGALSG